MIKKACVGGIFLTILIRPSDIAYLDKRKFRDFCSVGTVAMVRRFSEQ